MKIDWPFNARAMESITLHDPCYLGRHNGITEEPRELLERISGERPLEMEKHGSKVFVVALAAA